MIWLGFAQPNVTILRYVGGKGATTNNRNEKGNGNRQN